MKSITFDTEYDGQINIEYYEDDPLNGNAMFMGTTNEIVPIYNGKFCGGPNKYKYRLFIEAGITGFVHILQKQSWDTIACKTIKE